MIGLIFCNVINSTSGHERVKWSVGLGCCIASFTDDNHVNVGINPFAVLDPLLTIIFLNCFERELTNNPQELPYFCNSSHQNVSRTPCNCTTPYPISSVS